MDLYVQRRECGCPVDAYHVPATCSLGIVEAFRRNELAEAAWQQELRRMRQED